MGLIACWTNLFAGLRDFVAEQQSLLKLFTTIQTSIRQVNVDILLLVLFHVLFTTGNKNYIFFKYLVLHRTLELHYVPLY